MMVFLAVLLIFSSKTSKFRHSVTKKRQLLGDPDPPTGALPLDPTGGPLGPPPFAHSKYATASITLAVGYQTFQTGYKWQDDVHH